MQADGANLRRIAWWLAIVVAIALPWYGLRSGAISVPNEWNPWAPLEVEAPLDWTTRFKLARVTRDPALCLATLAETGMRYESVADRTIADGCGFENAVRVRATSVAVGEPFTLSCRSALALALWERHVVQPVARAYFDAPVTRLEHFGSYACRNVYGRKDAPLSRHATADALDIAGFTIAGGKRVSVARDWSRGGVEALFLRDVHRGACRVFDSVLGPEYNSAHRDHFHLDRGGYRVCR